MCVEILEKSGKLPTTPGWNRDYAIRNVTASPCTLSAVNQMMRRFKVGRIRKQHISIFLPVLMTLRAVMEEKPKQEAEDAPIIESDPCGNPFTPSWVEVKGEGDEHEP